MEVSDEQYRDALQIIRQYRMERGMEFYLPINVTPGDTITMDQFRLFLSLQNI